jgi:hypothetical protein
MAAAEDRRGQLLAAARLGGKERSEAVRMRPGHPVEDPARVLRDRGRRESEVLARLAMAAPDAEEAWIGGGCREGEAGTCLARDGSGVRRAGEIGIRPEVGGRERRRPSLEGMARTVDRGGGERSDPLEKV